MLRQADNDTKSNHTEFNHFGHNDTHQGAVGAAQPPVAYYAFNGPLVMLLLWLLVSGAGQFKLGNGSAEEVRTLYPSEWNVGYPAGLAYAAAADQLFLLNYAAPNALQATRPTMAVITPYEDLVAMVQLPLALRDVINVAYDDGEERLLVLDVERLRLARFLFTKTGRLSGSTYEDISHIDLKNPEGIAVDHANRELLLLDQGNQQVVRVDLDNELKQIATIDISHLNDASVRGIAVHPQSHHIFIASATNEALYELGRSGHVVNRYDLSALELVDPRALVFAPSADLTDDPDTIHLYLADSNVRDGTDAVYGQVVELTLELSQSHFRCSVD